MRAVASRHYAPVAAAFPEGTRGTIEACSQFSVLNERASIGVASRLSSPQLVTALHSFLIPIRRPPRDAMTSVPKFLGPAVSGRNGREQIQPARSAESLGLAARLGRIAAAVAGGTAAAAAASTPPAAAASAAATTTTAATPALRHVLEAGANALLIEEMECRQAHVSDLLFTKNEGLMRQTVR